MGLTRSSSTTVPKVIIFDWDDTICPSSFFDRQHEGSMDQMPERYRKILGEVARSAEKCLLEASKYGEVIIITNSDDGWVKYSCERIVPRLLPVLDKYKIVSARTSYEKFYPGQPLCWKAAAFAHEANEIFEKFTESKMDVDDDQAPNLELSDVSSEESFETSSSSSGSSDMEPKREIVSFGDAMEERTAVKIVSEQLDATSKSVMFIPSPSPAQIVGQLQMLSKHMKFVCEHDCSLDLEISPEQAERCAEAYFKRKKASTQQFGDDSSSISPRSPEKAKVPSPARPNANGP